MLPIIARGAMAAARSPVVRRGVAKIAKKIAKKATPKLKIIKGYLSKKGKTIDLPRTWSEGGW